MNVIKNIILFIQNIFNKKEKIKTLEENNVLKKQNDQCNKDEFSQLLKMNVKNKTSDKKIETLICTGDGLGIQKKITS